MNIITRSELARLTNAELSGVFARISREVSQAMPGSQEWRAAVISLDNIRRESRLHTDESRLYIYPGAEFKAHETVTHSHGEYVRGDVHTNSIEAFWANVKRGIKGTHVWVSKKHLQLYLREFEYRHNLRKQPALMLELLLQALPKVRVE